MYRNDPLFVAGNAISRCVQEWCNARLSVQTKWLQRHVFIQQLVRFRGQINTRRRSCCAGKDMAIHHTCPTGTWSALGYFFDAKTSSALWSLLFWGASASDEFSALTVSWLHHDYALRSITVVSPSKEHQSRGTVPAISAMYTAFNKTPLINGK